MDTFAGLYGARVFLNSARKLTRTGLDFVATCLFRRRTVWRLRDNSHEIPLLATMRDECDALGPSEEPPGCHEPAFNSICRDFASPSSDQCAAATLTATRQQYIQHGTRNLRGVRINSETQLDCRKGIECMQG